MNELTPEDCAYFDKCVQKWQERLNLQDWRLERGPRRPKRAMAQVSVNKDARLATYEIGASFHAAAPTPDMIDRTALHEVLHVFLHDAVTDPSDANEHRCINVLEKLLMGEANGSIRSF